MAEASTPIVSAALVVATLAVIALGAREAPRAPPRRSSATALVVADDSPPAITPASPIDLTSATASEIEALPRVGPALAARIVEARSGPRGLRSLEDLDAVRGVGPGLLARLAPIVRFGAQNRSTVSPTRNPSEIVTRPAPATPAGP